MQVAAGDNHSLCVTAGGLLFSWGQNRNGRLGVSDKSSRQVPTLVTELQGKQVVQVAAGDHHALCTTADGSVFTWGSGEDGQLGLGNEDLGLVPTLVRGELLYGTK